MASNNMTKPDDNYVLIDSSLCGPLRRDGIEIEVCIYRGEDEAAWILKVIDCEGNSFVWDERLENDQAAMDELLRAIRIEGMKQFNPHYSQRLN